MWPMTAMWASVARAGAVRVSSWRGRPSQAARSTGERVLMSRPVALSTAGELGFDHQQAGVGGSGVGAVGVAHRPDEPFAGGQPDAGASRQRPGSTAGEQPATWSQEDPLRALAESPTSTTNSLG